MSNWGARQWLKFVPEVTYGVVATEGSVGSATGPIYARMHQDNSFTVVKTPYRHEVNTTDALNRPIINISSSVPPRFTVAGKLSTYLYADNGVALNPFAMDMLAWASTLTSSDLPSYTATHFDSFRVRQWVGGKVKQLKISGSNTQDEGALRLDLDLVFQKETAIDPVFAEPNTTGNTVAPYPKAIYNFRELAGALLLPGVRTKFKSFELTIATNLITPFDENAYISNATFGGRTIDWMFSCQFVSKTDRDNFESQAALAGSAVFTKASPAHVLTLGFNAANYTTGLDRDLPLGNASYETLHLRSFVDPAVPGDFSFSAT